MSALGECLTALADVLDGRALRWFVFGAQAVAVRGAPRATQDIDITVEVDRSQLEELVDALNAAGFSHRYPDIASQLLAHGAVLPLAHRSGMMKVLGQSDLVPVLDAALSDVGFRR